MMGRSNDWPRVGIGLASRCLATIPRRAPVATFLLTDLDARFMATTGAGARSSATCPPRSMRSATSLPPWKRFNARAVRLPPCGGHARRAHPPSPGLPRASRNVVARNFFQWAPARLHRAPKRPRHLQFRRASGRDLCTCDWWVPPRFPSKAQVDCGPGIDRVGAVREHHFFSSLPNRAIPRPD
jgi:hypothetical protein